MQTVKYMIGAKEVMVYVNIESPEEHPQPQTDGAREGGKQEVQRAPQLMECSNT